MKKSTAKNYRVAKALLQEIEQYIKSAKVKKVAVDTNLASPSKMKPEWAYWACASLCELQSQGLPSLQNVLIPQPQNAETARQYGQRVLRDQEQTSDSQSLSQLLESLWTGGCKSRLSKFTDLDEKFEEWYDDTGAWKRKQEQKAGFRLLPSNPKAAIGYAENWAFALNGHVGWDKTRTNRQPNSTTRPWEQIQDKTKKGADSLDGLIKSVSDAIEGSIYKYLNTGFRWRSKKDSDGGVAQSMDSADSVGRNRYETGGGSVQDQIGTGQQAILNEEERMVKALISGEPILNNNGQELSEDEAIENLLIGVGEHNLDENLLYDAFVNKEFSRNTPLKNKIKEALTDMDLLRTDLTKEQIDQIKEYVSTGQIDESHPMIRNVIASIDDEDWLGENISLTDDPTEAAKSVVEEADSVIEGTVERHDFRSSETATQLEEVRVASQEVQASIVWAEGVIDRFESGDYHWLYDNHLYLENDWFEFVSGFNGDAMLKIDRLIKHSGNSFIATAMSYLVNRKSLLNLRRLKSIKHFVDNCMEDDVVKAEINQKAVLSWYLTLSVAIDPLVVQTINGPLEIVHCNLTKSGFAPTKWTGGVNPGMFGLICEALRTQTPTQKASMKKAMQARLDEIVPSASGLLGSFGGQFDTWDQLQAKDLKKKKLKYTEAEKADMTPEEIEAGEKQFFRNTNAYSGKLMYEKTRGTMRDSKALLQQNGWFGVIVSELVRFRYYLDLGMENVEEASDLIPTGLEIPGCADNVRSLLGPIPTAEVHRIKEASLSHHAEGFTDKFLDALKGMVKIKLNRLNKLSKAQDQLMKKLGAEDYDTLYEAYVEKK